VLGLHTQKSKQLFLLLQAGKRRLFWVVGIGAETQLERETRRQQRLETDCIWAMQQREQQKTAEHSRAKRERAHADDDCNTYTTSNTDERKTASSSTGNL